MGPSKLSIRVALRTVVADDASVASAIAEAVTEELNKYLPSTHALVEKGPLVHERSHGYVSFERYPASAWDEVVEVDGVQSRMTGSLLFILEYDQSLKSTSPSGSDRAEWARGGGSPETEGIYVPFTLEVGYFKRKSGMGFSPETRTEVGTGNILVADKFENVMAELDDPAAASNAVFSVVNDILAHPPAGSTEPLNGKARQRTKTMTQ